MKLVPEMYCHDIDATKTFYIDLLGFEIKYERREENFVYLEKDGIEIMFEQLNIKDESNPNSRRWLSCDVDAPFGLGVNFQIEVFNVEKLYEKIKQFAPESVFMDLEIKEYQADKQVFTQTQFIVKDPDGFLLRFCDDNE